MSRPFAHLLVGVIAAASLAGCDVGSTPSTGASSSSPAPTSIAIETPASSEALMAKMHEALAKAEWGSMKAVGYSFRPENPTVTKYTGRLDWTNTISSYTYKGEEIKYMAIGSDLYLSGNAAFWRLLSKPAEYANRWKLIESARASKMATITFRKNLDMVFNPVWEYRLSSAVEPVTANGKPAWQISYKEGRQAGYLVIDAATSLPVVLQSDTGLGRVEFGDWNIPDPLTAPNPADLITDL